MNFYFINSQYDLPKRLRHGENFDCVLYSNDKQQFKVHQFILTNSSIYFEKLVNVNHNINFNLNISGEYIGYFLDYIYLGSVQFDKHVTYDVVFTCLKHFDYLGCHNLEEFVSFVQLWIQNIETRRLFFYYKELQQLSHLSIMTQLIQTIKKQILYYGDYALFTSDMMKTPLKDVDILLELFCSNDLVIHEKVLFDLIVAWAKCRHEQEEEMTVLNILEKICHCVRFENMSKNDIFGIMTEYPTLIDLNSILNKTKTNFRCHNKWKYQVISPFVHTEWLQKQVQKMEKNTKTMVFSLPIYEKKTECFYLFVECDEKKSEEISIQSQWMQNRGFHPVLYKFSKEIKHHQITISVSHLPAKPYSIYHSFLESYNLKITCNLVGMGDNIEQRASLPFSKNCCFRFKHFQNSSNHISKYIFESIGGQNLNGNYLLFHFLFTY